MAFRIEKYNYNVNVCGKYLKPPKPPNRIPIVIPIVAPIINEVDTLS